MTQYLEWLYTGKGLMHGTQYCLRIIDVVVALGYLLVEYPRTAGSVFITQLSH